MSSNRTFINTLGKIFAVIGIAAVIFAAAFITFKVCTKSDIASDDVQTTSESIRFEFADIGELATQENNFTRVETYEDSKKIGDFSIPFTKKSFLYSYDGIIKAGIDFSDIDSEVNEETKTIVLTVPEARILSVEIDEDSFQMYDESNSILNPISIDNMNDSIKDMKQQAEAAAIENGILEKAEDNAKELLQVFVADTNLEGYSLIIK